MRPVRRSRNSGFSYIEILVGIALLAIVAGGIAQGLALASDRIGDSRVDTVASKLAAAQADEAHRMPYGEIGTPGGNPPGTLPATRTETVRSIDYEVAVDVDYVDDPALGQPRTFVNYKRVRVTVTPQTDGAKPVTESTLIAPPAISAISGKSAAVVTVVDAFTDEPLPNAPVTIDMSTSAPRTDTTDATGKVVFAGLEPSAIDPADPKHEYRLTATPDGYLTTPADGPDNKRQHLTAGQTWETTIQVFRPSRIVVNLLDGNTGDPVVERANVTVSTPAPDIRTEQQIGTSGTTIFDTIAGQPIQPSTSDFDVRATAECYREAAASGPVPGPGYPTNTTATFDLTMEPIAGGTLVATVVDQDDQPIPNAQVQVSGGAQGIAPRIRQVDPATGSVRYCIEPSGATPYVVSATAPGHGDGSLLAVVQEGQQTPLRIQLIRGATGDIELVAPGPNQLVRLRALVGTYDANQLTSSTSRARFRNLAPGDYVAYIATGFSDGAPVWSPGKVVRSKAGQNRVYRVR